MLSFALLHSLSFPFVKYHFSLVYTGKKKLKFLWGRRGGDGDLVEGVSRWWIIPVIVTSALVRRDLVGSLICSRHSLSKS